ncbi:MAG TPA: hypothetical protein VM581_05305 [Magnetospirillaceae bacterium]|nr:hypothetical protein [Magnetospirillaceae bacterium]
MPRRNPDLTKFLLSPQTCGEKRRYPTEFEAERVGKEQELLNPGLELRIYKCQAGCGGWHLTRRRPDMLQ